MGKIPVSDMALKNKVAEMATNNDTKKACDSDSKDEERKYMYNSEIPTGNYASASICETMGFEIRLCIPTPPPPPPICHLDISYNAPYLLPNFA